MLLQQMLTISHRNYTSVALKWRHKLPQSIRGRSSVGFKDDMFDECYEVM